ncbi:MAG TPA: alpha-hydroxy acid oxidase [Acidimicrobiia bacterium]|jgi:4-hydroxymandelate oxidase|nr:alpha-hydroxy acid oxidase [Acidimicrobiia bacterium]
MAQIPADPARLEAAAVAALGTAAQYFAPGTGDDLTRDDNRAAWSRLRLRPHVLRAVGSVDLATTIAGISIPEPVLVAPMALQRLAHPEGELATAAGAGARGTPVIVSMAATTAIESLAPLAPVWMQVYVLRDRGRTRALCERAVEAGAGAIVVSVDGAAVPYGTARAVDALAPPDGIDFPNLATALGERAPTDLAAITREYDPTITARDLPEVVGAAGVPWIVKGVLRGDDARACVDAGAAAVVVSNHGGRILDGTVATADALAEVVDALGSDAEVLVDGGIRRGTDVVRALALGARGVLVGRPVIWGLTLDGANGVTRVLDDLVADLRRALAACGVTSVTQVDRDLVARAG